MPPAVFASPFPALNLTLDERAQLHTTATEIIDEVQGLYEAHLSGRSTIDEAKWSLTREREDVRVYHDRRPGAGTGNNQMHLLLTVGTVLGDLHDAMYGVLNHSTNDMRVKTAYVDDMLVDSAVLETIAAPTVDEPFQSMTVRWWVKGIPLLARIVSKHPDNVYLEATGMRHLRNGERIGYHLMHSVAFKNAPVIPTYSRFNTSICTLWRQAAPGRVAIFMTSYIEIRDAFLAPAIVKSTADSLVSLWKVVHCAQQKKLAHLVQRKTLRTASAYIADNCAVCGSGSRSARRGAKSSCAICGLAVCRKCRIKRELAFFAPDGDMLMHAMRLCISCLRTANQLDAAAIARAEVNASDKDCVSGLSRRPTAEWSMGSTCSSEYSFVSRVEV